MTVPVKTAAKFGQLQIDEIEIANEKKWAIKHWHSLRLNYSKSPYFDQHAAFFEKIYTRPWQKLADLIRELTAYLLDAFGVHTKCYFSSQMKSSGKKDELVLQLCLELGADVYLSGPLGRNYLREEIFSSNGVRVRYDDYDHPTYAQAHPGFEAYMAALDLLFNAGPASLEIMLKNQRRAS